jgi:hypothetical protein
MSQVTAPVGADRLPCNRWRAVVLALAAVLGAITLAGCSSSTPAPEPFTVPPASTAAPAPPSLRRRSSCSGPRGAARRDEEQLLDRIRSRGRRVWRHDGNRKSGTVLGALLRA